MHQLPAREGVGGRIALRVDGAGDAFGGRGLAAQALGQFLVRGAIHAGVQADVQRRTEGLVHAEAPALGIAIDEFGVEGFGAAGSTHGGQGALERTAGDVNVNSGDGGALR